MCVEAAKKKPEKKILTLQMCARNRAQCYILRSLVFILVFMCKYIDV